MALFTRQEIIDKLTNALVSVTFRKVSDGEISTMNCTLQESLLPPRKSDGPAKVASYDVVKAYCPEKGWRSFRVDSVLAMN